MSGRANLDRLRHDLLAGQLPPRTVRYWLINGACRWEAEPDTSLERALGLIRTREARELRDTALAEAVKRMPDHFSTREKVRQIQNAEKAMKKYLPVPESVTFNNRPAWHAPLFEAMQIAPLPGERQLHNLCSEAGECTTSAGQ